MPVPESAVVHPLVLLSVVDHYNRVARDTKKRVVGLLLGEHSKGRVDITNSFAGRFTVDVSFRVLKLTSQVVSSATTITSHCFLTIYVPHVSATVIAFSTYVCMILNKSVKMALLLL